MLCLYFQYFGMESSVYTLVIHSITPYCITTTMYFSLLYQSYGLRSWILNIQKKSYLVAQNIIKLGSEMKSLIRESFGGGSFMESSKDYA